MHLCTDGESFDITFNEDDNQETLMIDIGTEEPELYIRIGCVTLQGIKRETLLHLANRIYRLLGEPRPG